jgi:hypothetical protein
MTNVAEIKKLPLNTEALDVLANVTEIVRNDLDTSEVLILVKTSDGYHRYATEQSDLMRVLGALRLLEHDTLRRMED